MKRLVVISFLWLGTSDTHSATLNVPADQPTIQAGIDSEYGVFNADVVHDGNLTSETDLILLNMNPPKVVSVVPVQNAVNIDRTTSIAVSFDIDMDPLSINNSDVVIHGDQTGSYSCSVSYDSSSRVATLHPLVDFHFGEIISVTVSNNVKSLVGTPLSSGFVWRFTVRAPSGFAVFDTMSIIPMGSNNDPHAVFVSDIDFDFDMDVIVSASDDSQIYIVENDGSGSFAVTDSVFVESGPFYALGSDLDNDGYMDLLSKNDHCQISVILGSLSGIWSQETVYANSCPGSVPCIVADFSGDGFLDVASPNANSHSVSILENSGNGGLLPFIAYPISGTPFSNPRSVAAGDFDGDGDVDIACANDGSNDVTTLLNQGDGTFVVDSYYQVGERPSSIISTDMNADGHSDLIVANTYYPTTNYDTDISILLGNGDGTFQPHLTYPVRQNPVWIEAADFDGDGDQDVVAASNPDPGNLSQVCILLNDGTGAFPYYTAYSVGGQGFGVTRGDLNGDGAIDLVVANRGANTITVLYNRFWPEIGGIAFDSEVDASNVVNHIPVVSWEYVDVTGMHSQDSVHIEVGSDDNSWHHFLEWR